MLGNNKFKKTFIKKSDTLRSQEDQKLQKAKQFPIQNLFSGSLKRTGNALIGCCPFHEDKKPSFAVYPETNTWYCFTELVGGDSISFYMKLKSVDFQTALGALAGD